MKKTVSILLLITLLLTCSLAFTVPGQTAEFGELTVERLSLIVGGAVSLLFSYFPGLKTKFGELKPDYQRLIMLAVLIVAEVAIYGLSCVGIYALAECTSSGAWHLVELFFLALIANQGTWLLSPKFKEV